MKKNNLSEHYNYRDYLVRKVVLYFLVFSLILSLIVMISFRVSQINLTEDLGSQIAYAFSEKVDIWVEGLVTEIDNISKTSGSVLDVNKKLDKGFVELCEEKSSYFETFFITNTEGKVNDCHNLVHKVVDREYFKEIILNGKDNFISKPLISRASGQTAIVIASKLTDLNGNTTGLFGGTVNLDEFKKIMSDIKIEDMGTAFIISEEGELISFSGTEKDYVINFNVFDAFTEETVSLIKNNESNSLYINNPFHDNRNDFVFINRLNHTPNWKLLVFVPNTQINSRVYDVMLLICILLIAGTIILTFIIRHSANNIVKPLNEVVKAIDCFDVESGNFEIPKTEIVELNHLKRSFDNMASNLFRTLEEKERYSEELSAAYEDLSANILKMEKSNTQLDKLSGKLENIFETAAQLNHITLQSEEEYLHHLLEILIDIIDRAEYGSVSLYEDDSWNFVCAIGHDIEKLKHIKLHRKDQMNLPKTIVVKNLLNHGTQKMDDETKELLIDASKPIGHTIIGELRIGEEIVGRLTVDSANESDEFTEEDVRVFDAFTNFAAAFLGTKRLLNAKGLYQEKLVLSIIKILEIHDPYTKGHSENVGIMAEKLASQYGLSLEKCNEIYWVGLVHDIGKILIPSSVLVKTGRLTMDEYNEIKQHPVWGAEILSTAKELDAMVKAVRYHHERWDGTGYPEGLKQTEIPLYSRIIAVADTFDAMTSDRSYRVALSFEDAVEEIKKNSGTQFDPDVVNAFLEMLEKRKILV